MSSKTYLLLAATLLAVAQAAAAYLLPTQSLDVVYVIGRDVVSAVAFGGKTLWMSSATAPLAAVGDGGRCLAVVNRPYLVYLNFTSKTVEISKYTIAYLLDPRGYPILASIVNINATAVATNCAEVAVGGEDGKVVVIGATYNRTYSLGSPITALGYINGTLYAGTADGRLYRLSGGSAQLVYAHAGSVVAIGKCRAVWLSTNSTPFAYVWPDGVELRPAVFRALGQPGAVFAESRNCSIYALAIYDAIFVRGAERFNYTLPSAPLSVAISGDDRVVAVGTLGGGLYLFYNGNLTAVWNLGYPVYSIALSYDGLAVAVETPNGISFYRLAPVHLALNAPPICGRPYAVVRPGNITVALGGLALLPAGSVEIYPQPVNATDYVCIPTPSSVKITLQGGETLTFTYKLEYRIEKSQAVSGPNWAYGNATFSAPRQITIPALLPSGVPGNATLQLVAWLVNGTEYPPQAALQLYINGPTSVEAVYQLVPPQSVVLNGVRYVYESADLYKAGSIIATGHAPNTTAIPDYAVLHFVTEYEVSVAPPGKVNGTTALWATPGSTVVFTTPAVVDFGNGTRLVFQGWSNGQTSNFTAAVTGPMYVVPIYVKQYLVTLSAYKNTTQIWLPASTAYTPPRPSQAVIQVSPEEKLVFKGWQPASAKIAGPTTFKAVYTTEYYVVFKTWLGSAPPPQWLSENSYIDVAPNPGAWGFLFQFIGWRAPDGNVYQLPAPVVGPGVYEAVWQIKLETVAIIAAVVVAIAGLVYAVRRGLILISHEE